MSNLLNQLNICGKVLLAPMAGVTDAAFRQVCQNFGAAATYTEMVSAKAVEYNDKKTASIADVSTDKGPVFLQIFGSEPDTMALAAQRLAHQFSPSAIDINMGCPVPKIAGNGAGSALMKTPELCGKIVSAVKNSVDIPVTVKLRIGWDKNSKNVVEVAKICENSGADAICVHGRTREQMYTGTADWDAIKQVKEAVSVPVIGNGDVTDAQSACKMLEQTGCDLIMVGRGALGNPWIFREINAYLTDSCRILPPPGIAERVLVIRNHIAKMCECKGEPLAMREARKHIGWYIHGLRGAAEFRRQAGQVCTLDDLDRLLVEMYKMNVDNEQV